MLTINRTVLIVTAKQSMADWLCQLPDWPKEYYKGDPITLADVNEDFPAYLIPEYDTPMQTLQYIDSIKMVLFEEILCGWTSDEKLWPKKMSRQMFDEWFTVKFHTVVHDLDLNTALDHDEG